MTENNASASANNKMVDDDDGGWSTVASSPRRINNSSSITSNSKPKKSDNRGRSGASWKQGASDSSGPSQQNWRAQKNQGENKKSNKGNNGKGGNKSQQQPQQQQQPNKKSAKNNNSPKFNQKRGAPPKHDGNQSKKKKNNNKSTHSQPSQASKTNQPSSSRPSFDSNDFPTLGGGGPAAGASVVVNTNRAWGAAPPTQNSSASAPAQASDRPHANNADTVNQKQSSSPWGIQPPPPKVSLQGSNSTQSQAPPFDSDVHMQDMPPLGSTGTIAKKGKKPPTILGSKTASDIKQKNNKVKAPESQKAQKSKGQPPQKKASATQQQNSKSKKEITKKPAVSVAQMFAAKPRAADDADSGLLGFGDDNARRGAGDEMQLLRLMQEGKVSSSNKGRGHRQRTRPRKKKFSALKKNVLKERLKKWQELHPPAPQGEASTSGGGGNTSQPSRTVCLVGFAEAELLEDEDEAEELINNLNDMAAEVSPFDGAFIPNLEQLKSARASHGLEESDEVVEVPAFVRFADVRGAEAAVSCWSNLTMGGQKLNVKHARLADWSEKNDYMDLDRETRSLTEEKWGRACLEWVCRKDNPSSTKSAQVILENVLTEDDLEDDDCLEESLQDIRTMAEKYGKVADVQAERAAKSVVVSFDESEGSQTAQRAAENLGKTVIGGSTVVARVQQETSVESTCYIILKNALSEDDLEDEDCLEESLGDLRELAGNYGTVLSVDLVEESAVKISFQGASTSAQSAASGFRGMVMGGAQLEVVLPDSSRADPEATRGDANNSDNSAKQEESKEPEKLFSGDKLIGESWAECKRVPKIPNSTARRPYATMVDDETAKPLIIEMLGELMRLQKRAVEEDKNTKTKRRLVMGLREVAKGIRTRKMKMVCMANNLDEYGAIDAKLEEILDLAYQEDVPVFFELSKRGLGKAIGKNIKVAVIGIQNAEGAHQIFKKLVKIQPPVSNAVERTA